MRRLIWSVAVLIAMTNCNPGAVLYCGPGTTLVGNVCVALDAGHMCGTGTTLIAGRCRATSVRCGTGTLLVSDQCVAAPDDGGTRCGLGTILFNGECVAAGEGDGGIACGAGTVRMGNACVSVATDGGAITCGTGTTLIDDVCVRISIDGGVRCGAGTVLVDDECLLGADDAGMPMNDAGVGCPTGTNAVGSECIPNTWRKIHSNPAHPYWLHLSRNGRFLVYVPVSWSGGATAATIGELRVADLMNMTDDVVNCRAVCPFPEVFSDDGRWGFANGFLFDFETKSAKTFDMHGPAVIVDGTFWGTKQNITGVSAFDAVGSIAMIGAPPALWTHLHAAVGFRESGGVSNVYYVGEANGETATWVYVRPPPRTQFNFTTMLFPLNHRFVSTTDTDRVLLQVVAGPWKTPVDIVSVDSQGMDPKSLGAATFASVSPDKRKIIVGPRGTQQVRTTDGLGTGVPFASNLEVITWVSVNEVIGRDISGGHWKVNVDTNAVTSLGFANTIGVGGGGGRVFLPNCQRASQFSLNAGLPSGFLTLHCTAVSWVDGANTIHSLPVVRGMTAFVPYDASTSDYSTTSGQIDAAATRAAINVMDIDPSTGFTVSSGLYVAPIPW